MARQLRIEYENAYYHVTSRGNARSVIFRDAFDKEIFLDVIREAHLRHGFFVHAFVLMGNHYHLLMETPDANLSMSMRQINGVYTQAFNRRHKTVGHLLQGRFKAIVVDRDSYYLELIRYIHLNPLRAGVARTLDDFKYSGHRAIIDKSWEKRCEPWFARCRLLQEFGPYENEALRRYREFVSEGKGVESPLQCSIGGYALGSRDFAARLWEEFIDGRQMKNVAYIRQLRPNIDVSKAIDHICRKFCVSRNDIFKSRRGKIGPNLARGMVVHLLCRHSGLPYRDIGSAVGGVSATAISTTARAFERILSHDEKLRRVRDRLLKSLTSQIKT